MDDANKRIPKLGHLQPPHEPTIEEHESTGEFIQEDTGVARQTVLEGRRDTRRGRRGKRQRGINLFQVVTINTSGHPQLQEALGGKLSIASPDLAIVCQEHHRSVGQLGDLQAMARRRKWTTTAIGSALGEGGGASAGVAIFTPAHIPCGLQEGMPRDLSPKGSEGRAVAVWVQRLVPCGVLLISVYLHTGEGPSPRNTKLLEHVLSTASASGPPWVIGGDFQDTPQEVGTWAEALLIRAGGEDRSCE